MNKKLLWLLLMLPLAGFTFAEWVSFDLDARASILFPAKPEHKIVGDNDVYMYSIDSTTRCMVMSLDFSRFGTDSAGVAAELSQPESIDKFGEGIVGQVPGSKITSQNVITFKGKPAFVFEIDSGSGGKVNRAYTTCIFVGTKMYSLSFYETTAKPHAADRVKFFNSFKLKY